MFIILAFVLLSLGVFMIWTGRKGVKAMRPLLGWTTTAIGIVLIALALFMVWAVFAFYSQPLKSPGL
jgi:hypothetical protein